MERPPGLERWLRGPVENRVAVLHVGASPRLALIMLVGLALIAALGIAFAAYCLRLMLRPGGRQLASLPSSAPIQPS